VNGRTALPVGPSGARRVEGNEDRRILRKYYQLQKDGPGSVDFSDLDLQIVDKFAPRVTPNPDFKETLDVEYLRNDTR